MFSEQHKIILIAVVLCVSVGALIVLNQKKSKGGIIKPILPPEHSITPTSPSSGSSDKPPPSMPGASTANPHPQSEILNSALSHYSYDSPLLVDTPMHSDREQLELL